MHSKNKKPMTEAERRHVTRVKLQPCGVCSEGGGDLAPSEAHEIHQGMWWLSIPLCADCHRGGVNGLHGQRRIWDVLKKDVFTVLNDTLGRIYG